MVDKTQLIQDLLNWLSEDDVLRFCKHNEYPTSLEDAFSTEDDD